MNKIKRAGYTALSFFISVFGIEQPSNQSVCVYNTLYEMYCQEKCEIYWNDFNIIFQTNIEHRDNTKDRRLQMLGLKRGAVALYPHEMAWETEAQATMARLRQILGPVAVEMAHVGSTAIPTIQAKPILDIAVAVDDFDALLAYENQLRAAGFYYRPNAQAGVRGQLLFASGSYYDGSGDLQTRFIHIVRTGSVDWQNYILFRDYLRAHPDAAGEYERLKLALAAKLPTDSGREDYVQGKQFFIRSVLRRALSDMLLGKTVDILVDRPLGSHHPKHTDMIYPVNYGYVTHIFSADGEEADVYLLGVSQPVEKYKGRVIAVIHRLDDVEDKWIAAPTGVTFTPDEIEKAVHFQEQYFRHEIEIYEADEV